MRRKSIFSGLIVAIFLAALSSGMAPVQAQQISVISSPKDYSTTVEPCTAFDFSDCVQARLVRIVDGDTFVAEIETADWGARGFNANEWKAMKVTVRAYHFDTFEISKRRILRRWKKKERDLSEQEKNELQRQLKLGEEAKLYARYLLRENAFVLQYMGKGGYGRSLAKTYFMDGTTLKQKLAEKGLLSGRWDNGTNE